MRDIVYACDNNYIEQTIVSMVSLLKKNCYPIQFWIVSDHITEENQRIIQDKTSSYQRKITFLNVDDVLDGVEIASGERHPKTVYTKLFLETIIGAERILYLDSDTVVNGSLEELWKRDMSRELAAGVQMPYSVKVKSGMDIAETSPYLCDGIVLLNLQLWRMLEIGAKCKSYISEHEGQPPMLSEGTLNYVCQGYIGVLKPEYNLMPSMILYTREQIEKLFKMEGYYSEQELDAARKYPIIIHYINELYNRPWLEPCDHPYKMFYREEYKELFGECPYQFQRISKNTRMTRLLRKTLPFFVFSRLYHLKHKEI